MQSGLARLRDAEKTPNSLYTRFDLACSAAHALCLAAQLGHDEILQVLLDAGEDPDRYCPQGFHAHSTPLHQSALAGHLAVVRRLVEHGARLDIRQESSRLISDVDALLYAHRINPHFAKMSRLDQADLLTYLLKQPTYELREGGGIFSRNE